MEALCHNSCNKIYFDVLNAVHQCREASMCLVGRSVTIQIGISRHDLAATNERLVGANGAQIELDCTVFLNIIMGNITSSQIVILCQLLPVKTMLVEQPWRHQLLW